MSWVQDLASFVKRLITLETRVESNAEEIKALREDLKSLTEFTQKVAFAVKRNQDKSEDNHTILVKSLENELLKLECRLNASNQSARLNGSASPHKSLPHNHSISD